MNNKNLYLFSEENFISDESLGKPPFLDTFASNLLLSNISFPKEVKDRFESICIVPAFVFYMNNSEQFFYRLNGVHDLLPSHNMEGMLMHLAFKQYDFLASFLSTKFDYKCHFYESYPSMITYTQMREGNSVPKGNRAYSLDGKHYLQLFHHTTKEGKAGIINEKKLFSSKWNFCGTREIKNKFVYMTDISIINSKYATLPILMRHSSASPVFRSDDEEEIVVPPISLAERKLNETIRILISSDLIQPNPIIMHQNVNGQPRWLEIAFVHIYRCPCSEIILDKSILIDGEQYWIVEQENVNEFRTTDPICYADGNSCKALLSLIDECYMSSE